MQRSILIVEDDLPIRDTMQQILEMEGYRVQVAADGLEALSVLKTVVPSLILLDLMMPIMNGWQFLDELELSPEARSIPVVIVSAAGNAVSAAKILGRELIRKPIQLEALLKTVKRYCDADGFAQKGVAGKYG